MEASLNFEDCREPLLFEQDDWADHTELMMDALEWSIMFPYHYPEPQKELIIPPLWEESV